MNTAGSIRALGILGVAVAALASGGPAVARDFHGPARGGPATHWSPGPAFSFRDRGGPYFYRSPRWFPSFGTVVTVLPDFYTTFWFGGVPYYYADGTYYVQRADADGYVVTNPPAGAPQDAAPAGNTTSLEVFAYPRNGQGDSQQATDRNECRDWAVGQAGGDPVHPAAGTSATAPVRDAYLRALTACLEGRGYSVK